MSLLQERTEAIQRSYDFGKEARRGGEPDSLCPMQRHTMARSLGYAEWDHMPGDDKSMCEGAFHRGWAEARYQPRQP